MAHHPRPDPPRPPPAAQAKEGKKAKKFQLGVFEAKLGSAIQEATGVPCVCNELVGEVLRGCRLHFTRFIGELKDADLKRAQLGLAHSYSRAKVRALGGRGGGAGPRARGTGEALQRPAAARRQPPPAPPPTAPRLPPNHHHHPPPPRRSSSTSTRWTT
jgi:hypothetical protein